MQRITREIGGLDISSIKISTPDSSKSGLMAGPANTMNSLNSHPIGFLTSEALWLATLAKKRTLEFGMIGNSN